MKKTIYKLGDTIKHPEHGSGTIINGETGIFSVQLPNKKIIDVEEDEMNEWYPQSTSTTKQY